MRIYIIRNKINGKGYVGQTIQTLHKRMAEHTSDHSMCTALKSAIHKYGKDSFEIQELAEAKSIEHLNSLEIEFIKELNTMAPNGYNLKTGGNQPRYSEESRERFAAVKRGKRLSEEHKKKLSEAGMGRTCCWKGKKLSESHKQRISEGTKGRIQSRETREKISAKLKGHGFTKETRAKMRAAKLGKVPWNKGKKTSSS